MKNTIQKIFKRRTYYVVDPVDFFIYTYGNKTQCQEAVTWLTETQPSGMIFAIWSESSVTPDMIRDYHASTYE